MSDSDQKSALLGAWQQTMEVALRAQPVRVPSDAASMPTAAELFVAHGAFVWRTLRALGVSDADVDDVVQEVFVVVHRRLPELKPTGSVKSWLYSIAVRSAHGWRRRPARRELATDAPPERAVGGFGEAELDAQRRSERLLAALATLDEDKRVVFLLYELERMTLAEIAEAVAAPLQTVYSRLGAARKALFRAFGEEEEE